MPGISGVGGVGAAFLNQLARVPNAPQIILLARSTQTLLAPTPSYAPSIPAASWKSVFKTPDSSLTTSGPLSPEEIAFYLSAAPGRSVLVDNTSDQTLANAYPLFLSKGISVVTPNKKAFSSDLALWKEIFSAAVQGHALVYHESTVGAGLPVLSTLRDLVATGDRVTRIEGVFSGTLSFLFNTFAPAAGPDSGSPAPTWSAVVSNAKQLGYTEPDPRDDLNGMDVSRKLTILARLAGLQVSGPDSFPVQSLIPPALASLPSTAEGIEEFMTLLPEYDDEIASIRDEVARNGKVIRYVGSVDVDKKQVKVGLVEFERDSPIAALKGSDNIISFYTERYGANPLIIQGAGAGADVTAMGVLADLLKVVERLH